MDRCNSHEHIDKTGISGRFNMKDTTKITTHDMSPTRMSVTK